MVVLVVVLETEEEEEERVDATGVGLVIVKESSYSNDSGSDDFRCKKRLKVRAIGLN